MTGQKLRNEEVDDLCTSRIIVQAMNSRGMEWVGRVARMGGKEKCLQDIGGNA